MGKLYLAAFYLAHNNQRVYKIGYTGYSDAKKRFEELVKKKIIRGLSIICTSWVDKLTLNPGEVWKQHPKETEAFNSIIDKFGGYKAKDGKIRFHNFWVEKDEKIGITEIRNYNQIEVDFAKELVWSLGERFKNNQ